MKTIAKAFEEEMSTTSKSTAVEEDEVYEYDGTNEQYLLPTTEDNSSTSETSVPLSKTGTMEVKETDFLDSVKGFFKEASEFVTDSFSFVGLDETYTYTPFTGDPYSGTKLADIRKRNVEWAAGMTLPSEGISDEEYNAYLEAFNTLTNEARAKDAAVLSMRLVEEGYRADDIIRLMKDIKALPPFTGSEGLFKEGHRREQEELLYDDPEAFANKLEGNANVANANFRLLMLKAAEAPYQPDKKDTFLEHLGSELGQIAAGVVGGLEALPFADKARVAQMNKDMRKLFAKYGSDSAIWEGLRIDPTNFYKDASAFFYNAAVTMPTSDFSKLVEEFDAVLSGVMYSDVAKADFWNQVLNVEEYINGLSWAGDVASMVPLARTAVKGGTAIAKSSKMIKRTLEEQKAAKAAGHTVESLSKDIEKAEEGLAKAKTPAQKRKAEKAVNKLKDLQSTVRGDKVEAAKAVHKIETGLLKATALGATSEVFPAIVLASRAAYAGVTAPHLLLKAIGDYTKASKLFAKGFLNDVSSAFKNTTIHQKAVTDALEFVNQGYGPRVVKDGVNLGSSPALSAAAKVGEKLVKATEETRTQMIKALSEIVDKGQLTKITEAALDGPRGRTALEIRDALGKSRRVRPVLVNIEDTTTGTLFTTRLSSYSGKGWKKLTANKVAADVKRNTPMDAVDDIKVVENADGFHVDVSRKYLRDENSYKFTDDFIYEDAKPFFKGKEKTLPGAGGLLGPFMDYVKSTGQTVTTFQRTLGNILQHDQGVVFEVLSAFNEKITKGNKRILDHLIRRTRSESKWFDSEWLKTVGVDDKTIKAYEAYIGLSDLSYMLHKRNLVNNLIRTGKKDLIIYTGDTSTEVGLRDRKDFTRLGIGKRVEFNTIEYKEVFLVSDFNYVDEVFIGEAVKKVENPDDYNFYQVLYGHNTSNNLIAIRKERSIEKRITSASVNVSYIPGRMLFSPNSRFIKQAITASDGTIKDIRTLFAHPDKVATDKVAKAMEAARQIAIKYDGGLISADKAAKMFTEIKDAGLMGYPDFYSFYKSCTGKDALFSLRPSDVIQSVEDGGMLQGLTDKQAQEFFNFRGASFLSYSNAENIVSKRLRKMEDIFNPFTLEEAPRVTPTEEIAMTVHNIMTLSTKAEYTRVLTEDMVRVFNGRKGCETTEEARLALLYGAPNKAGVTEDTARRLNHMKRVYQTLFGLPTDLDRRVESFFGKLAHYAVPDYAGKGGLRTELYYGLRNWNPVKQIQALAFHWYLGLLNPRQLYKQASSIFSTTALSPVAGSKALALGVPFTMYVMTRNKALLKNISKVTGYTAEEIDNLAKIVERLDISSRGSYSGALDSQADLRTHWKINSTFFYDTGERLNRYFSALVTAIEKGRKFETITEGEWAAMLTRQNNLYFNMGRAGMSPIQTSYWRILTQFQGWTMRWWETMFDRQIPWQNKLSLAIFSTVLGGTTGLLGRHVSSVLYNYAENRGMPVDYNLAIANGVANLLVKKAGGDINVGEFADVGAFEIFESILSIPSVSAAESAYKVVKAPVVAVYDYFKNYDNEEFSFTDSLIAQASKLAIEGDLPSGVNKTVIALTMLGQGIKYKANGLIDREDVDALEALAFGLGFRSIDEAEEFLMRNAITDHEKYAKEVADTVMTYFTLAKQYPSERDFYLRTAKTILNETAKTPGVDIMPLVDEALAAGLNRLDVLDIEWLAKSILEVYDGAYARDRAKALLNLTEEKTNE